MVVLSGLKNVGNTCYFNAVLQCLANAPEIVCAIKAALNQQRSAVADDAPSVAMMYVVLVQELFREACTIRPLTLLRAILSDKANDFSFRQMEDSHELLVYIIDRMNDDIATTAAGKPPDDARLVADAAQAAFVATFPTTYSRLVETVYGQCVSEVTSLDTTYASARYEAFSTLSLPIPDRRADDVTLYNCLDQYFADEVVEDLVDDVNHRVVRARKTNSLSRLPPILIVTLLRFGADGRKVNRNVAVPHAVDLAPYAHAGAAGDASYKLFALVNHIGLVAHGGHYTALCARGSQWIHFDDEAIKPVPAANIITPCAYILFFRRV
jgi:ubiquitin carboxyl-terminal hydrolase 8